MKKMLFMMFLLSCVANAGYIYPTFNYTRCWLERQNIPITVESGVLLGLTNPNVGNTSYDFEFRVVSGDVYFEIPYPLVDGGMIFEDEGILYMSGIHKGPGSPVWKDSVILTGYGIMGVYDGGVYQGEFTIVPEPSSFLILGVGVFVWRVRKQF